MSGKTFTLTLTEEQAVAIFAPNSAVSKNHARLLESVMTDDIRQAVEDAESYRALERAGAEIKAACPELELALLGKGRAAVLEVRPKGATEGEPR